MRQSIYFACIQHNLQFHMENRAAIVSAYRVLLSQQYHHNPHTAPTKSYYISLFNGFGRCAGVCGVRYLCSRMSELSENPY